MDFACLTSFCPAPGPHLGNEVQLTAGEFKLSALFLLLGLHGKGEAVITNVSVIQSWRWFFQMSPFESVFLALIIGQIFILGVLGILPINLNEFWHQNPAGRKKRNVPPHVAHATKEIAFKLLKLYKKLDQNECGFRALCELQSKVSCGGYDKRRLSRSTQLVLTTLLRFAKRSENWTTIESSSSSYSQEETRVEVNAALKPFAEAVLLGSHPSTCFSSSHLSPDLGNSTICNACQEKYGSCPVTSDEIIEYCERISVLDY